MSINSVKKRANEFNIFRVSILSNYQIIQEIYEIYVREESNFFEGWKYDITYGLLNRISPQKILIVHLG